MGRGGARAKASGGTMAGEGALAIQTLSLNLTLFQFLQTGYFEKDLLSYCANRLAEYSCIYWLDPNVDGDTEGVELHTAAYQSESVGWTTPVDAEFTKYPSHFINLDRGRSTGVTVVQTLTEGQPITGTFLGPVNVREVLLSEHGTSVAVVESNRLPLDAVARVILPFLLFLACLSNLFILRTAQKLTRRRLPLAVYFVYITLLDQVDLMARGTDYLVEAYGGIRLFTAVQFLGRAACQLLPMVHSGLRHVHAALLIGFAIDTWRFARSPPMYAAVYRREWTRNVLILASALAVTVDSQFLWTFDLSQLETKTLHERLVRNAYECGFSATTSLSPIFLYLIWPFIDHMWAEVLPCAVCGCFGTGTIVMLRLRQKRQISATGPGVLRSNKEKPHTQSDTGVNKMKTSSDYFKTVVYRWFDGYTIHEAPKAFGLVVITDCVFIIPRAIYYLTKYGMFANYHTNRVGSQFFGYDTQPDHPNLVAIGNTIRRVARLRQYEPLMEGVEAVMRYLGCLHMIVRCAVLIHNLTVLRKQLATYWRTFRRLFRWILCTGTSAVGWSHKKPAAAEKTSITSTTELTRINQLKQLVTDNGGSSSNIRGDKKILTKNRHQIGGNRTNRLRSGTRNLDVTTLHPHHEDSLKTNEVAAASLAIHRKSQSPDGNTQQQLYPQVLQSPVAEVTLISRLPTSSTKPSAIGQTSTLTKQIYSL